METVERLTLTFLVNALWQVPVIALAASLLDRLLQRGPSRYRHALWSAALLLSLALPLAGASMMAGRAPEPRREALAAPATLVPEPSSPVPPAQPASRSGGPLSLSVAPAAGALLTLLYGLFLGWRALRLGSAYVRTRRLAHRLAACEDLGGEGADSTSHPAAIVRSCRAAFGLERVRIVLSKAVQGPVTLGLGAPAIALPEDFASTASDDELRAALGHEMAHVARRDYARHLACEILRAPLAFHPAARWIARRIAESREMACDDMAVERLVAPRAYASALLSLSVSLNRPAVAGHALGIFLAHGFGRGRDAGILEERMKRLVDTRPRRRTLTSRLLIATALAALAVGSWLASTFSIAAGPEAMPRSATKGGSADPASRSALQGHWVALTDTAEKTPFAEVDVRIPNDTPEVRLTLYKMSRAEGKLNSIRIDLPVVESRFEGDGILFTTHSEIEPPNGEAAEPVDETWFFRVSEKGEGQLASKGNAQAGQAMRRRMPVPPPPPPLPMTLQRESN